jgi:predicted DNA-binding transcriptional regulator AlpA
MNKFVTLGEIAEYYGVVPSAVSNWRKRLAFPKPVAGNVFRGKEIEAWMEHRKNPCPCAYCPAGGKAGKNFGKRKSP